MRTVPSSVTAMTVLVSGGGSGSLCWLSGAQPEPEPEPEPEPLCSAQVTTMKMEPRVTQKTQF